MTEFQDYYRGQNVPLMTLLEYRSHHNTYSWWDFPVYVYIKSSQSKPDGSDAYHEDWLHGIEGNRMHPLEDGYWQWRVVENPETVLQWHLANLSALFARLIAYKHVCLNTEVVSFVGAVDKCRLEPCQ